MAESSKDEIHRALARLSGKDPEELAQDEQTTSSFPQIDVGGGRGKGTHQPKSKASDSPNFDFGAVSKSPASSFPQFGPPPEPEAANSLPSGDDTRNLVRKKRVPPRPGKSANHALAQDEQKAAFSFAAADAGSIASGSRVGASREDAEPRTSQRRAKEKQQQQMMLIGGGVVAGALLIGLVIALATGGDGSGGRQQRRGYYRSSGASADPSRGVDREAIRRRQDFNRRSGDRTLGDLLEDEQ